MSIPLPPPLPPANWYDDPDDPRVWRWWNGQHWTDARSPKQPPAPVAALPTFQAVPHQAVPHQAVAAGGSPQSFSSLQPWQRVWATESDGTVVLREPRVDGEPWAGPDPVSVKGRRPWGLGDVALGLGVFLVASFVLLLTVVFVYTAIEALAVGAENIVTGDAAPPLPVILLGAGAASALGFLGVPLWATYRKGRRNMAEDFGLKFSWLDIPIGIVLAVLSVATSVGLALLWKLVFGQTPEGNTQLVETDASPSFITVVVAIMVVGIFVPIFEEVFFRGLVLRSLLRKFAGSRYMVLLSVGISSFLFGALHVNGLDLSGLLFPTFFTMVIGVAYAIVCYKTQRLGAAIIGHAGLNTTVVLAAMVLPYLEL